jgi:hypothetical protein
MAKSLSTTSILTRPITITAIVAAVSVGALLIGDHTDLIRERAATPRGPTLAQALLDGVRLTPTQPESPVRPKEPGPKRVDPPVVTSPPPSKQ